MIQSGELDPVDFAQKASELGFSGIEYVSALYSDYLKKGDDPEKAMEELLLQLKDRSVHFQVENVLIMVDGEGHLAELDDAKRNQSVENHKKWVDAAAFLGCHSIRVNAHGEGSEEEVAAAAVKGLSALAGYAAEKGIQRDCRESRGLHFKRRVALQCDEGDQSPELRNPAGFW